MTDRTLGMTTPIVGSTPLHDSRSASKRVRVLIVEDSSTIREFLTAIIDRDPRLEVVGAVSTGEAALGILHKALPDVISMDIRLPGIDGLETTRRIMAERPTPIVVFAASVDADDMRISMRALQAGAVSILEKPAAGTFEDIACRLCSQLVNMSDVKVITQHRRVGAKPNSLATSSFTQCGKVMREPREALEAVGIVASTGGPNALLEILRHFSPDFSVPVFVVQHIAACFTAGFIDWLAGVCPLPVQEARNGNAPKAGVVYLPPADRHLRLCRGIMELDEGPLVSQQRPSGTVLFESMAQSFGVCTLGVLLTGMGDDGSHGLSAIRNAGGHTITEHPSTAVVYGMPAAAVALGASCESLPLQAIGPRIREMATR